MTQQEIDERNRIIFGGTPGFNPALSNINVTGLPTNFGVNSRTAPRPFTEGQFNDPNNVDFLPSFALNPPNPSTGLFQQQRQRDILRADDTINFQPRPINEFINSTPTGEDTNTVLPNSRVVRDNSDTVTTSSNNTNTTGTQNNSNTNNSINDTTQQTNRRPLELDNNGNTRLFNPFGGVNLQTALFQTGQSLRNEGSTANTITGIAAGAKSLFSIGRTIAAGAGFTNRQRQVQDRNRRQIRQGIIGNETILPSGKNGGLFQFLKNGGKIEDLTDEQALTGEYITGLPDKTDVQPNAEIEVDEYVKHPNGDVQKVVGKTHKQGGEKVLLEVGTLVVSDNLKVGADFSKNISKEYDLKLKASDTYANVIDKYTKKLGLDKLNKEQEQIFKKLKKQEDTKDQSTKNLNNELLSSKIKEIEDKKAPLEKLRSEFTDMIFEQQEKSKAEEGGEELEIFKDGGVAGSRAFKALAKKFNLTEEQALKVIKDFKNGGITKMEDGDEVDPPARLSSNSFNTSNLSPRQRQKINDFRKNGLISGNVTSEEELLERMQELFAQNPRVAKEAFNIRTNDKGELEFDLEEENIRNFQQGFTNNFNNLGDFISNSEDFTQEQKDEILSALNNEVFIEGDRDNARDFDGIFGNFTSSRPGAVFNTVTPEDLEKLKEKGITSYKDLLDDNGEINKDLDLSDSSLDALNKFKGIDANFLLDQFEEGTSEPTESVENNEGEIRDRLGFPLLPDQSALPPDALQPETKINRRFERLDPVRITNEENIKEINRSENFIANQLSEIPDSQRRAALANLAANSQENINKSVTQVNIANANNQQQTDQFNIGQSNLEENARAADTLDFERRALTGLSKTRTDLRNFFDFNRRVALGNFNTINRLNLLNQIHDNFNTDGTNIAVDVDNSKTGFRVNTNVGLDTARLAQQNRG